MIVLLMAGGCSSNDFRVYKDGKSYYLTSGNPKLGQLLCDSGDMDSILKDSGLPTLLQNGLKEGVCASSKSKERLADTLNGMTKAQRSALKDAFRRNGYEINKVADACGGG